jgi:hypothetical protein
MLFAGFNIIFLVGVILGGAKWIEVWMVTSLFRSPLRWAQIHLVYMCFELPSPMVQYGPLTQHYFRKLAGLANNSF